jgi:hypothetical protein
LTAESTSSRDDAAVECGSQHAIGVLRRIPGK